MIGFKNQETILLRVVDDLVHPAFPNCWNLVLPPGFGDGTLGRELERRLKAHESHPFVARVSPDTVRDEAEFVRDLHRRWKCCRDSWASPLPEVSAVRPNVALEDLIAAVADRGAPVVLILQRFHTILDRFTDDWILGVLRDAEQTGRLRTITLTPMPYTVLRLRWEQRGHFFCNSDYGTAPEHSRHVAEPLDNVVEAVRVCAAESVELPEAVARHFVNLTGAFPEAFQYVLGTWVKRGRPPVDRMRDLRSELAAREDMRRFVRWLDPLDTKDYRELVIKLYQGVEIEETSQRLASHPWERILLDSAGGLRAECVGRAALLDALQDAGNPAVVRTPWSDAWQRARSMYVRQRYQVCLELLRKVPFRPPRPHVRILESHAQVMALLYGDEGDDHPGGDTDWGATREAVRSARRLLSELGQSVAEDDRAELDRRYDRLEQLSAQVLEAAGVQGPLGARFIDVLAGLVEGGPSHPETAAMLLVVKGEAIQNIDGDETACVAALPLPEQIFRIWAFWHLKLNYYRAPAGRSDVWEEVTKRWPREMGEPRQAEPGQRFDSLPVFAHFAYALLRLDGSGAGASAPEPDGKALQSALSLYDSVRTGRAHSLCLPSRRQREKYFALIDRWLDALLSVCPPAGITRQTLRSRIEPLPAITEDNRVQW